MRASETQIGTFGLLLFFFLLIFFTNLSLGSISIPLEKIFKILFVENSDSESWNYIVLNYRLPKACTAILVGSGLGASGLLMQTLFRNPLAGPFVLGISAGASLGVALLILGTSFLGTFLGGISLTNWSLIGAASTGSFFVLFAVLIAIKRIKNTMSILIIGLMFGSISAAVINVLSYFSTAEKLQQFIFWSFGSLGNLNWIEVFVFGIVVTSCFLILLTAIKPLNSLLLGENYAISMGVDIKKTRYLVLICTSLLTGVITAFSGPIAFVGLAVPHLSKLIFTTSNHRVLLPASALVGAMLLLLCDTIAQLPGSEYNLPINAITSIFGAPLVIWLLIRKKDSRSL